MKSISQSPVDPDFVQDPYPFYARARAMGDIVWWEEYEMPVAFGHRAANEILRDRRLGRESVGAMAAAPAAHLADFAAIEAHSMLEADPPRHTRLRKSIGNVFSPARIQAMAPTISAYVDESITALPSGPFDIIETFCAPLPVRVIAHLLGVAPEMAPQLLAWSHDMVALYQARRDRGIELAANAAAKEFSTYVRALLGDHRGSTGEDLLSALIHAEEIGALSRDEVVSTTILLLNAGHEATTHALSAGIYHTLTGVIPKDALRPDSIAGTVDELLRYDPPLHMFMREVNEDVNILGFPLAGGSRVGVCLGAANRDPRVFAAPDQFDPTRPGTGHLALGAGIHFCIGAALARLELQIALPVLFSRMEAIELVETPRFANLYHFHGLERLIVRCC